MSVVLKMFVFFQKETKLKIKKKQRKYIFYFGAQ